MRAETLAIIGRSRITELICAVSVFFFLGYCIAEKM